MNYTNIQNGLLINQTGPITGITNSGSLSSNSYTLPTESIVYSYVSSFVSANTSAYTQTQSNANFISQSNIYTQTQANADFLSANTSYYTQAQSNANFLSANTSSSYYTQTQANANFLSANTSYYTQAQSQANFVYNTYSYALTTNMEMFGIYAILIAIFIMFLYSYTTKEQYSNTNYQQIPGYAAYPISVGELPDKMEFPKRAVSAYDINKCRSKIR